MSFSDRIDDGFSNLSLIESTNMENVFSAKSLEEMAFKGKKKNSSSSSSSSKKKTSLLATSAKVSEVSPSTSPVASYSNNASNFSNIKQQQQLSGKSKSGKREEKYIDESEFDDISSNLLKSNGAANNNDEDEYDEQGTLRFRHSSKQRSTKVLNKYQNVFGSWTADHEKYLKRYRKFKRNWARLFQELWLSAKLIAISPQACQDGQFILAVGLACCFIVELIHNSPKYNLTIFLVLLAGEKFPHFPLKSVKPQIVISVATGITIFLDIWYMFMVPAYVKYSMCVFLIIIILAKCLALYRYLSNARGTLRARKYLIRRVRLFIISRSVPKRIMRDVRARILAIGWIQLFATIAFGILFTLSITAFGYHILFVSATNGIPLHLFLIIKTILSSILFIAIYSDANVVVCLSYFGCLGFWMAYVKSYLRSYKIEYGGWPYPYSYNSSRFYFISIGKVIDVLWGITGWVTVGKQLGRKWSSMETNLRTFLSFLVLFMFIADVYCSGLFYIVHWLRHKHEQNLLSEESASESDDSELDELHIRKKKSNLSSDLPKWMKSPQDEFMSSDDSNDDGNISQRLLSANPSSFLNINEEDEEDDDDDGSDVVDEFLRLKKRDKTQTYEEYEKDDRSRISRNSSSSSRSTNSYSKGASDDVIDLSLEVAKEDDYNDVEAGLLEGQKKSKSSSSSSSSSSISKKKTKTKSRVEEAEEVSKLVEALMDGDDGEMDNSTHYRDNDSKSIEIKVKSKKSKDKKKKKREIDSRYSDDDDVDHNNKDSLDNSSHYKDNEIKTIEIKVKARKSKDKGASPSTKSLNEYEYEYNNSESSRIDDIYAADNRSNNTELGVGSVIGRGGEGGEEGGGANRSETSRGNVPELNLGKISSKSSTNVPVDRGQIADIAEYGDGYYLVTSNDLNMKKKTATIRYSIIAPGENPDIHGMSGGEEVVLIGKSDCIRTQAPPLDEDTTSRSQGGGGGDGGDGILLDPTCEIERKVYRKLWKSISVDSASFSCTLKSLTKLSDDKEYLSHISGHLKSCGFFITAMECLSSRKLGIYLFSVGYVHPNEQEPADVKSRFKLLQARLKGRMKPVYCLMNLSFSPLSTDATNSSNSRSVPTLSENINNNNGITNLMDKYSAEYGPQRWALNCSVKMTDSQYASDFVAELNLGSILEIID